MGLLGVRKQLGVDESLDLIHGNNTWEDPQSQSTTPNNSHLLKESNLNEIKALFVLSSSRNLSTYCMKTFPTKCMILILILQLNNPECTTNLANANPVVSQCGFYQAATKRFFFLHLTDWIGLSQLNWQAPLICIFIVLPPRTQKEVINHQRINLIPISISIAIDWDWSLISFSLIVLLYLVCLEPIFHLFPYLSLHSPKLWIMLCMIIIISWLMNMVVFLYSFSFKWG